MATATSADNGRHHQPHQYQQQQHQQPRVKQSTHQGGYADLTPQSSFSSTTSSSQHHHHTPAGQQQQQRSHQQSYDNAGTRSNSNGSSRPSKQQHLGSANGAPPSPISPSSPLPIDSIISHMGSTRLEDGHGQGGHGYDQAQYQQPRRKTPTPQQQQDRQQRHLQQSTGSSDHYGGREPREGQLKQSGSSASVQSVRSTASSRSQQQQQQLHPSHSNGSSASSPRPSARHRQPSPGPPLSPSYDDDYEDREGHHQKQAFQYQQKLQQKPPSIRSGGGGQGATGSHGAGNAGAGGAGSDSDDSDSGSMLSYRRSISRLSMSYKRTNNGVPNISLFAPNQRQAMLHPSRSSSSSSIASGVSDLTSAQLMIQNQREERLRQQQQQQQHQQQQQSSSSFTGSSSKGYGSAASMASIDQHSRQEDGRPVMPGRGNNSNIHIPERNSSAENVHAQKPPGSGNNSRTRQNNNQQQQQQQQQNYAGRHSPSSPNMGHRQLGGGNHGSSPSSAPSSSSASYSQAPPRPSHESAQSQRSQQSARSKPNHLNLSPNDYESGSTSPLPHMRSKSPARSPGSPAPGSSGRGGPGYAQQPPLPSPRGFGPGGSSSGQGGLPMNMHPAHHLPSGGYVRPEEAVGPANPMPEKAEDFVRQGIEYHEVGDIAKATHFFRTAAELGDPVGMLMYGLSVRHGWGCQSNRALAFQYLQKSAEHAVGDLKSRDSFASTAAKGELVLAIYELGICFRHGWGADKNKKTAAYYFEIAANLGDPDAQNDLAWCYYHGVGVKKDMFKSAKYYRLAAAQGLETVGNSWIWKDKYGGMPASPTGAGPLGDA